jgi:hypothetical protein
VSFQEDADGTTFATRSALSSARGLPVDCWRTGEFGAEYGSSISQGRIADVVLDLLLVAFMEYPER